MAIDYSEQRPGELLQDFVFSFWKTRNKTGSDSHYSILPDAGIELIISLQPGRPNGVDLFGLSTDILDITIPNETVLFGVRFKLLAVEYLLHTTFTIDSDQKPRLNLGTIELHAQTPLAEFVQSMTAQLLPQINGQTIDPRKQKLLDLVYRLKGAISVQQLALETGWAPRQINRYFRATFGLPLKAYLEQLQFYASLPQLGQGDFYPQADYYDQSHFIRQTKKHTGRTPKQLYLLRDVRFVQLGHYARE